MSLPKRVPVKSLGVTAGLIASWIAYEGFTSQPIIPVKGDVPTIGHGSTHYEDGRKVKMSDPPINRTRAKELAVNLLDQVYVRCVKRALGDALVTEKEFELAADFAGQYGCYRYSESSMAKFTKAGQYAQACAAYRLYKYVDGYNCSTPGNKICPGVWTRSLARAAQCEAQLNG